MSRYFFSNSKVYSILGYFFSQYSVLLYIMLLLLFFNWIYLPNNSWLTTKYNWFVSLSSACVSICLSIRLTACRSVGRSVCLSVCLFFYLSVCLSACSSVYLSACLSVKLFLHFFVCVSDRLTVGAPFESSGTLTNAKAGVQIGKLEREC